MILSGQVIQRLSDESGQSQLIAPFDKSHLRGSSYDLTVGNEYYIGQEGASSTLATENLRGRQSFSIPPHAVCFILTGECIHLPDDVTAKVSLRMTHIYAGMVLTSQPPFDPSYKGRVVVMLHNLSSEPFHLKQGERLATIEFARIELSAEKPLKVDNGSVKPKVHRSVQNLEGQLPRPLISSLSEIASKSKAAHDKVMWLSSQMLIFAALLVAMLAIPGFLTYSNLQEQVSDQKGELAKMREAVVTYQRELEQSKLAIDALGRQFANVTQHSKATDIDVRSVQSDIREVRQ